MKLLIKEILEKSKKTRYQIAKESGISEGILCDIVKGRKENISLKTAYKIAKSLNVKIDDLIKED